MKHKLLTLLLLSCVSNCYAYFDFTGSYQCNGFDPYLNKKYAGTIVVKQQNTVYSLTMAYDTGETYNATAGLFDTDTISVVFQNEKDLKSVGLERYTVSDDHKKIQGYWVYLGGDKLGTESCQKMA